MLAAGEHYLGEVDAHALCLSTPFAEGIGETSEELCGALTGGLMAIGAIYGRADNITSERRCMDLAKEYRLRFVEHFRNKICKNLKKNWVGKVHQESCAELAAQAVGILVDVLESEKK
ncbi:MAG: C_GCAxxG_C_C family protein [Anaerolineaceae bacterium]|nr:C_GCAxxG_C_C family protein [Anaerolineaceae bacterium]